ncbi:MAG: hypothetical protein HYV40_05055 [Candidatus Levybacteria bacterium]|nr:hypothetical protein [Candidatus Levybacteria bacterium]
MTDGQAGFLSQKLSRRDFLQYAGGLSGAAVNKILPNPTRAAATEASPVPTYDLFPTAPYTEYPHVKWTEADHIEHQRRKRRFDVEYMQSVFEALQKDPGLPSQEKAGAVVDNLCWTGGISPDTRVVFKLDENGYFVAPGSLVLGSDSLDSYVGSLGEIIDPKNKATYKPTAFIMVGPSYGHIRRVKNEETGLPEETLHSGLTLIYAPTGKKRKPVEGVHLQLDTPLDQSAWSYTLPDRSFIGSPLVDSSGSVFGILRGWDDPDKVNGAMSPIGVLNSLLTQGEVHKLEFPKDTP